MEEARRLIAEVPGVEWHEDEASIEDSGEADRDAQLRELWKLSILLDSDTRVLVQGATGAEARRLLPTMTDYGTRVVAGVSPGKGR